MTTNTQKIVIVAGGSTGPTGTMKGVNILGSFTGLTGMFAQWKQATGGTGPHGTFETVYNIGPTGIKGEHKTVIIPGFSGGGSPGATTTWNAATAVDLAISNGNLTATYGGSGNGSVIATNSYAENSGKMLYLEITNIANLNGGTQSGAIGVGNPSVLGTSGPSGVAYYVDLSGNPLGANPPNGRTICMALDFTHNKLWLRYVDIGLWNNDVIANQDPASNKGGFDLTVIPGSYTPFFFTNGTAGGTVTANFGQSTFLGVMPAGYSAWG